MANKPYSEDEQITDVEFIGAGDGEYEDDERTREFKERMREASKGATLNVLRVLTSGKHPHEHIEEIPIERYDWPELLEYLRKEWGAGEYRIQLRDGGSIRKWASVVIAKPLNNNNLPSAPKGHDGDLTRALLERMDNLQAQLLQKNSGSEMEFLEKMKIYRDLFSQPQTDTSSGLKQMAEMLGFFDKLGIGFEKDTGPRGLEAFAPVIGNLIDAAKQQPQTVPQQAGHNLATNPAPRKEPQQNADENYLFKVELNKLVVAASKNGDPGIYAQVIEHQIKPEIISAFFIDEKGRQELYSICPDLKNYPQWIATLIEHLKHLLGLPSTVSHEYENNAEDLTEKDGDDKKSPHDAA